MVEDDAFSHKIDYVAIFQENFNILLNGWVLSIGGASAVKGLLSTGPTPLVTVWFG